VLELPQRPDWGPFNGTATYLRGNARPAPLQRPHFIRNSPGISSGNLTGLLGKKGKGKTKGGQGGAWRAHNRGVQNPNDQLRENPRPKNIRNKRYTPDRLYTRPHNKTSKKGRRGHYSPAELLPKEEMKDVC